MRQYEKNAQSLGMMLLEACDRLSQADYLVAIRRGLILPFPLIMIGALALLLRYPPFELTRLLFSPEVVEKIELTCDILVAGTFGIASLVVLTGFSAVLTMLHNNKSRLPSNPSVTATVVAACFFILVAPTDGADFRSILSVSKGLMAACLTTSIAAWMFLRLSNLKFFRLHIKSLSHDPLVGDVFAALPAAMVTILSFAILKVGLITAGHADVTDKINQYLASPFLGHEPDMVFAMAYEAMAQIMWFFGLHGPNMLHAVQDQILIPATVANHAQIAAGLEPQHIVTSQFFDIFIRIGGSGSTLSLIFALLFVTKSANSRKFALIAFIPALCNINEPLLFGIPLVLNPVFVVPFILVPVIQTAITYLAMSADILPLTSAPTAWTTPAFISGYMVTGGALTGAGLQAFNIIIGAAIYFPFVKLSEFLALQRNRNLLKNLLKSSEIHPSNRPATRLLGQFNEEGRMAMVLADDLLLAMKKHDQIFLEYQPQIDIRSKKVVGVEALLRWNHPIYGRIAPPITITLSEDLGIVHELGYKILRIACEQRMAWSKDLAHDVLISVNVAPRQLADPSFDIKVQAILEETGLSPKLLELEITESTALLPEMHSIDCLVRLRNIGVKIALDDFGMGHTSLHYLRMLPLDVVKIDRSLTIANSVNEQIVKSIQDLTASLEIATIVEGVESEEQVNVFASLGCTIFQGYLFSKPLPHDEIVPFTQSIGFTAGNLSNFDDLYMPTNTPRLASA